MNGQVDQGIAATNLSLLMLFYYLQKHLLKWRGGQSVSKEVLQCYLNVINYKGSEIFQESTDVLFSGHQSGFVVKSYRILKFISLNMLNSSPNSKEHQGNKQTKCRIFLIYKRVSYVI